MASSQNQIAEQLDKAQIPYQRDVPIGPMTWYRVGGAADFFCEPVNADDLSTIARLCHNEQIPMRILGRGANLLVCDKGVDGIVIKLSAAPFTQMRFEDEYLIAGAGCDLAQVINTCVREGLSGLETLAGIPATIGGAIQMNAGGKYGSIGPVIEYIDMLNETGDLIRLTADELKFEYRQSNLEHPLILSAIFKLTRSDKQVLRKQVLEIFDFKKSTQPLGDKSAGCIFKNPPQNISLKGAGQLIDEAGLKNTRVGGARVSDVHANFFVTETDAKADDVLNLMKLVRTEVESKMGIRLINEVVVWPENEFQG